LPLALQLVWAVQTWEDLNVLLVLDAQRKALRHYQRMWDRRLSEVRPPVQASDVYQMMALREARFIPLREALREIDDRIDQLWLDYIWRHRAEQWARDEFEQFKRKLYSEP
jgi:hypothetical protein